MKILFYVERPNHQLHYAQQLAEGMKRHGLHNIEIVGSLKEDENADLIAVWAWKPYINGRHSKCLNARNKYGTNILVMERAFMGNRHEWISLGYNGLNGRADFVNKDITDNSRWLKHFSRAYDHAPIKPQNNKVLICGQCVGDASIHGVDIDGWYFRMANDLIAAGYAPIFREHPLNKRKFRIEGIRKDDSISLEEALSKVSYCVSYNSNSTLLSTLHGIPSMVSDIGSMSYEVNAHSVDKLGFNPDLQDWKNRLAYCQWLPDELKSGEAWDHLKRFSQV